MNILDLAALVAVHPGWPTRIKSNDLAFIDHAACVYACLISGTDQFQRGLQFTVMPPGWVGDGTPCSYCSKPLTIHPAPKPDKSADRIRGELYTNGWLNPFNERIYRK